MAYELVGTGHCPVSMPLMICDAIATAEQRRENMRSAISRNLPQVSACRAHGHELSIAGGGPSLEDTYSDLTGYIGAVNRSHDFLIQKGTIPNACLLLDPDPVLADAITPHHGVTYFVASMCDPAVFDKLRGQHVVLWHAASQSDEMQVLDPENFLLVCGGSTVSLRWINVGYLCGFRTFNLHGMDSSYKRGRHHAYEQPADDAIPTLDLHGYETYIGLAAQVPDFFRLIHRLDQNDVEPVAFNVFGDGLLQHCVRQRYNTMNFTTRERPNDA